MSETVIRVEGLSKQYRIGTPERYRALRDSLASGLAAPLRMIRTLARYAAGSSNGSGRNSTPADAASRNGTIWALKDVSFEVHRGEAVGLVGRNGAGKTTLLKVLAQITRPTQGRAEVRGRVGSLLEVGTGFHPELTGRENTYLSGAILGMTKSEIDRKFDEIVAFSGVERFLDTPLKHYSSGMQMRLAFAVAAHLEPEILLVDEVLAVGDIEFQKKCLGKMEAVTRGGRTVLFVSHNMGAIRRLCTGGVWLDNGAVRRVGSAADCIDAYSSSVAATGDEETGVFDLVERPDREGTGKVQFTEIRLLGDGDTPRARLDYGESIRIQMRLHARESVRPYFIGVAIYAADGTDLLSTVQTDSLAGRIIEAGESHCLVCRCEHLVLRPGSYFLQASVLDSATWEFHDWFYSIGQFSVEEGTGRFGRIPDSRPGYLQPVFEWNWK